jgi:hypothetical protein
VLAVPVMLGGLLLVTARPAAACTCAQMTEAQLAARVDVLFVGTLVSSRVDPSVLTREYREERNRRERVNPSAVPESDPVVLTFEVSRVYKGAVGKRQEIVRLQLDPGQYLSGFTRHCLGSRALAAGGEPGGGRAPGVAVSSPSSTRGGPPAAARTGPDSSPSPTGLLIGGALAAGVGAGLGLAILRARRRASADQ